MRGLAGGVAAVCAGLFAAAGNLSAAEAVPQLQTISVQYNHPTAAWLPVLTSFETVIETKSPGEGEGWYLADAEGRLYPCQIEPVEAHEGKAAGRVRGEALLPRRDGKYRLLAAKAPAKEAQFMVSSVFMGAAAVLETPAVTARFQAQRFCVAEEVSLFGLQMVPRYVEGLVNRQQGVTLTVTDRVRHADVALAARMEKAHFALARHGPVAATVEYRGAFVGAPDGSEIPFEAEVTLTGHGVIGVKVAIAAKAYDGKRLHVKDMKVTLPIVLDAAAAVVVGGAHTEASGRDYWTGAAKVSVAPGGAYAFTDGDGSVVSGKGGVTWMDYSDGEAGAGIFWGATENTVSISVDYNEDLLDVTMTPGAAGGAAAEGAKAAAEATSPRARAKFSMVPAAPGELGSTDASWAAADVGDLEGMMGEAPAVDVQVYFFLHPGRAGEDTVGALAADAITPTVGKSP
jgi:hypothetical protein